MAQADVLSILDSTQDEALERLFEFLRIPSIGTDPAYDADTRRAAEWVTAQLRELGARADLRDTPGQPMVVGHVNEGMEGPHLLFYGHYDVQPVDPLELWHRDPFDPAVEDTDKGRVIRARGANDDKGQLMTFIEACRAWKAVHGSLPCRITFFLEGEEESGSPSLTPFMRENAEELKADIALICDTSMFDPSTPAITTMLRGILTQEIAITGPDRDLHSGSYGGAARNPARVLAKVIAGLHDDTGRITLPGFYEGVDELSNSMRAQWDGLGFDGDAFLREVDLSQPAGEEGRSILEQLWARPTCDVNGIWSGYTGDGFKTVLPSVASAKISFRLVGKQSAQAIRDAFHSYVRSMLPPDCSVEFKDHGIHNATVMSTDNPMFEKARQALTDEWPNAAAFIGAGGSIPITGHFKEILDLDSMLIGFGQDDDGLHSPNEKYNLDSFQKGARSWVRILDALTS